VTSEDSRFSFRSREPEQTRRAARALARVLPEKGLVLSLSGGLGAGKTLFVKGLAAGLGLDPDLVTSPTFAIVNEYRAVNGPPLIHLDFYRLESEMALEEVGFLDLLAMEAVLAIEWGDRFAAALPLDRMELRIDRWAVRFASTHSIDGGGAVEVEPAASPGAADEKSPREFCATARGPESLQTLHAWRDALLGEALIEPVEPGHER
jgi:tRNA threonylcarbamoyladenosine biosynthesis protein TsaE